MKWLRETSFTITANLVPPHNRQCSRPPGPLLLCQWVAVHIPARHVHAHGAGSSLQQMVEVLPVLARVLEAISGAVQLSAWSERGPSSHQAFTVRSIDRPLESQGSWTWVGTTFAQCDSATRQYFRAVARLEHSVVREAAGLPCVLLWTAGCC